MRFRSIVCLVAVSALAFGCSKKGDKTKKQAGSDTGKPTTSPKAPVNVEPEKLTIDPSQATWKAVPIQDTGVSVEAVDQAEHKGGDMGEATYFRQNWGPAQMALWYGPNRTIENWREGFRNRKDVTLSEPKTLEVCGTEALMQEATIGARSTGGTLRESIPLEGGNTVADEASGAAREQQVPTGSKSGGGAMGTGRGTPEMVVIVLTFKYKDTFFIVSFRVPTAHRDAFKTVERHFFESVSCG